MKDRMIRATASNGEIRVFAATTREMVETARCAHDTSPVVTAALGRLLTAGAMMGSMMKGDKDVLTLQVRGDGPMKGLTVTANSKAQVKGYALVPQVILPANAQGKLDVGGAIGNGYLSVIKDMGLKEPYLGRVDLQTGEIAEDLTYYFATSEQVPSSVGLGVLMNRDNTVKQAGGFIIQLMPFASEETISLLEQNLSKIHSVTSMLDEGNTPEEMVKQLLAPLELELLEEIPTGFVCDCDKKRVEKVIVSIGAKEIHKMIEDGETIEVKCQFCNSAYHFTVDELKQIEKYATKKGK